MRQRAELHYELLFKQPPPEEDCPICMIRLPALLTGRTYMSCCGKVICHGCIHAPVYDDKGNEVDHEKCPFCRTPAPISNWDMIKRFEQRMEQNDPEAIRDVGTFYSYGRYGLPQNHAKALELWIRAAKLGSADAYYNIGSAYRQGSEVEQDINKAVYYWELAAIEGSLFARYNLGVIEGQAGNMDRALNHFMIAAGHGDTDCLESIKQRYLRGFATKDDYTKALRSYQAYLDEIKSKQRDQAAAFKDEYKYYESAV